MSATISKGEMEPRLMLLDESSPILILSSSRERRNVYVFTKATGGVVICAARASSDSMIVIDLLYLIALESAAGTRSRWHRWADDAVVSRILSTRSCLPTSFSFFSSDSFSLVDSSRVRPLSARVGLASSPSSSSEA